MLSIMCVFLKCPVSFKPVEVVKDVKFVDILEDVRVAEFRSLKFMQFASEVERLLKF